MYNLFVVIDNYNNGFNLNFLDLVSIFAVISGILVITSKNPIISVLFLISLFLSISGYLFLIGMNFIGLSYLLVYIGAISILFLFILMLINVRVSELQSEQSNSLPLASIISVCFYYITSKVLPVNYSNVNNNELFASGIFSSKNESISYVQTNTWESNIIESSHITSIGNIMYTNYFIWLMITSIILLLAMVGAIIITLRTE